MILFWKRKAIKNLRCLSVLLHNKTFDHSWPLSKRNLNIFCVCGFISKEQHIYGWDKVNKYWKLRLCIEASYRKILSKWRYTVGGQIKLSTQPSISFESHISWHRLKALFRLIVGLFTFIGKKSLRPTNWLDKILPRSNVTTSNC